MAIAPLTTHKPTVAITAWFIISSLLVIWDFGFIFGRPYTFPGGKLFTLWSPYELYGKVDLIYSRRAWDEHWGFTAAQAWLNVAETILNITYLYLAHYGAPRSLALAPLVGFTAVVMTESKTALYWLQDHLGGPQGWVYTGHNNLYDWIVLFAIPNGAWLIFPLWIAVIFGKEIAHSLRSAAGVAGSPVGPAANTRSRTGRKSVKAQ